MLQAQSIGDLSLYPLRAAGHEKGDVVTYDARTGNSSVTYERTRRPALRRGIGAGLEPGVPA